MKIASIILFWVTTYNKQKASYWLSQRWTANAPSLRQIHTTFPHLNFRQVDRPKLFKCTSPALIYNNNLKHTHRMHFGHRIVLRSVQDNSSVRQRFTITNSAKSNLNKKKANRWSESPKKELHCYELFQKKKYCLWNSSKKSHTLMHTVQNVASHRVKRGISNKKIKNWTRFCQFCYFWNIIS